MGAGLPSRTIGALVLAALSLAGCTAPAGDGERGGLGLAGGDGPGDGMSNANNGTPSSIPREDWVPYPGAVYREPIPDQCARYEKPGKVVVALHVPWEEPAFGWGNNVTWNGSTTDSRPTHPTHLQEIMLRNGGEPRIYFSSPEAPEKFHADKRVDVRLLRSPDCLVFDEFQVPGPVGVHLHVTHPSTHPHCYWIGIRDWGRQAVGAGTGPDDRPIQVKGHFTLTLDRHFWKPDEPREACSPDPDPNIGI